jgi:tripartite-type tricarboxylate transporter receptor subunit TctC
VENRPGASGAIGLSYLANARPDGYTLYMSATEPAVLPAVRTDLPFASEDFTYLMRPFLLSPLLVVGPHVPVSTTQELIDYMKANPGKLRYGTPGVGHLVHLGTAMFQSETGVEGVHIPYPGIAPIYTDLLAGNIDFTTGANLPFPNGLKVLGPVGTKHSPAHPDLPTLAELGYPNAGFDVWFGLLAPPELPQPIADRLIKELESIFEDPEAIAKFQSAAKIVPDENPLSGSAFKDTVVEENIGWRSVVEKEGITVQ